MQLFILLFCPVQGLVQAGAFVRIEWEADRVQHTLDMSSCPINTQ